MLVGSQFDELYPTSKTEYRMVSDEPDQDQTAYSARKRIKHHFRSEAKGLLKQHYRFIKWEMLLHFNA